MYSSFLRSHVGSTFPKHQLNIPVLSCFGRSQELGSENLFLILFCAFFLMLEDSPEVLQKYKQKKQREHLICCILTYTSYLFLFIIQQILVNHCFCPIYCCTPVDCSLPVCSISVFFITITLCSGWSPLVCATINPTITLMKPMNKAAHM